MEKLKIRWLWLMWFVGTGICYCIYLAQEAAMKNWHPRWDEVKAPLEDLDIFIILWVFVGTGLLLSAIWGSLQFLFIKIKKRAKISAQRSGF